MGVIYTLFKIIYYVFFNFPIPKKELMIDRIILNISAHQKPSTANPGTITPASIISRVSTTRVKSPIVRMFIGSVKNNTNGLINALIRPNTIATTRAARSPEIITPGNRYATTNIIKAVTNQLRSICAMFLYYFFYKSTVV